MELVHTKAIKKPKEEIWAIAENIAKEVGYEPGKSLIPLIQNLKGIIYYQDLNEWFSPESGSIEVQHDGSFKINISDFTGRLRNRFTIAHELGHYFLHANRGKNVPKNKIMKAARFGSGEVEEEANDFAGAFLMPKDEFLKVWEKFNGYILSVAGYFLVSRSAAKRRYEEVG